MHAIFKQFFNFFHQQFASFIVGDSCDGINKLLVKFLDSQLDGDDTCFDVVAVLEKVHSCPNLMNRVT